MCRGYKFTWIFIVIVPLLPLLSAEKDNSAIEPYSSLWLKGTLEEKKVFISGISLGMGLLKNNLLSDADQVTAGDSSAFERLSGFINQKYQDLSFLGGQFEDHHVIKAMDVLYGKELNKNIPFGQMYQIAVKEMKRIKQGQSTPEKK